MGIVEQLRKQGADHTIRPYPEFVTPLDAAELILKLELALHRIAGHGNITGDKAREIAAEALGITKPGER